MRMDGEQENPEWRGERSGPEILRTLRANSARAVRKRSAEAGKAPGRNEMKAPGKWWSRYFPPARRKMRPTQPAFRDVLREIRRAELLIYGLRPQQARQKFLRKGEAKHISKTGDRGLVCGHLRDCHYRDESCGHHCGHRDHGSCGHLGHRRHVRPANDFRNAGDSAQERGSARAELRG